MNRRFSPLPTPPPPAGLPTCLPGSPTLFHPPPPAGHRWYTVFSACNLSTGLLFFSRTAARSFAFSLRLVRRPPPTPARLPPPRRRRRLAFTPVSLRRMEHEDATIYSNCTRCRRIFSAEFPLCLFHSAPVSMAHPRSATPHFPPSLFNEPLRGGGHKA